MMIQMHPNEKMLRNVYDAFSNGKIDALMEILDENIRWHVDIKGPVAGDYFGKDGVLKFFRRFMDLYGSTFWLRIINVVANEDIGVVFTEEGGEYNNHKLEYSAIHVYTIKDGKLTQFQTFTDSRYDKFWLNEEQSRKKESGAPTETVISYLDALNRQDYETARQYLQDEGFSFKGPLASHNRPEELLSVMKQLRPKFDVKKSFAEGNDVCLIYELTTKAPTVSVLTSAWYKVEQGKIVSIITIFDPRPFASQTSGERE
jgi:ketosteroid isomerase-like protein/limonene-1,2-epoxide hydrolase